MTTANELITQSYNLADIVSLDFELPTGAQITTGLQLLNGIIGETSMDAILIPYFTHFELPCVIGQEVYIINGLIELSALTFNDGTVRFPMTRDSINRYNATARVDNIQALPFHYYVERERNASKIYLYFLPQQTFELKITGKFMLTNIQLGDVVTDAYDAFYVKWLKYRLASELCQLYSKTFNPEAKLQLDNLERRLNKVTGTDLSITKANLIVGSPAPDMYGQANLGRGWTVG